MRKLLFFFLDGVGLGNSENNPIKDLFKNITGEDFLSQNFPKITEDYLLKPIDAVLGVPGLPQSATGQTSLMTGINGQKILGHHHTAFPNEILITLIKDNNLLLSLKRRGLNPTCANMYSKEYFEKRSNRRKNMFPVSALSIKHSDIPFKFLDDYNRGEAVFADITNDIIKRRGYPIDIISPENAADNMLNICSKHDFVFFEYFITDTYGHKKLEEKLKSEVIKINRFLRHLWNNGDNEIDIIITSDHGNCEDISTGNHTTNPVPFFYLSKNMELKKKFHDEVKDITQLKNSIFAHFNID